MPVIKTDKHANKGLTNTRFSGIILEEKNFSPVDLLLVTYNYTKDFFFPKTSVLKNGHKIQAAISCF